MGTYIAELQVVVDTSQLEKANKVLSDLNQVAPKVEKTLGGVSESFKDAGAGSDGLTAAQERLIARVEKLSATVGESRAGVLRYDANLLKLGTTLEPLINKFDTLSTAQKSQDAVSKAIVKSQESLSTAQYRMIESLREEIAVFGKSREEVLLYKAGLMGIEAQVSPLITKLNELKAAKQAEAQAGQESGDSGLSKREREKAALAAQVKELENNIRLWKERDRAANASATAGIAAGPSKEAEAALVRYEQQLDDVRAAQRELDATTNSMAAEYSKLRDSIDPTSKALDDIVLKQDRLNEIYRSGTLAIPEQEYRKLSATLTETRNKLEGVGNSTDSAKVDFEQLRGSIDPVAASLAKLDAQQDALNAAFKNPNIKLAQAEYDRLNTIINNSRQRIQDLSAQTGKTAKEINFAMRGLPAQFTDIFVSLQGGQAPLTVFLQQGGQLKDMFGGVGPAFKAMGGYVVGLINPFTIAAAVIGTFTLAAYQGYNEVTEFNKALILTGNRSATTGQQLNSLAGSISSSMDISRGKVASAVAEIASLGKVGASSLESVSRAAIAMNVATGKAIADTVEEFASLSSKPSEAVLDLNKKYNFLTASVYEQIAALEDQGRTQEAAKVAEEAYASMIESRSQQVIENLNLLGSAWHAIKRDATEAWDAMAGVGRTEDPAERIRALRAQLGRANGPTIEAPQQERRWFEFIPAVSIAQSGFDLLTSQSKAENEAELERLETQQRLNDESVRGKALEDSIRSERLKSTETVVSGSRAALTSVEKLTLALKEQEAALFSLEETGGLTPELKAQSDKAIANLRKQIKEAEAKEAKKAAGPAVKEDSGTALLNNLKQRESVLRGQLETTTKLGAEEKKLAELTAQFTALEKGSAEGILTIKQKQILAQKDVLLAQQNTNVELEKANRLQQESAKLEGIKASIAQRAQAERRKYSDSLLGAGMSDRDAGRLREQNKLQQDYQDRIDALRKEQRAGAFQDPGKFNEALQAEKAAYDESIARQQKYYSDEDKLRSDWSAGASKAWKNYLDEGRDVAGMTAGLFSSAFGQMEDALVGFVTTGKLSFKDLAVSILADLARIAVKKAIVGAIDSATSASSGSGWGAIISAIGSAVAQKDGGGWSGGTQFFAKGGAFTNSVVSKPTAFGTSTGLGVMGEAGPEAILPLTRTADGQLGVQAAGGMSSSVIAPVSVTVNTDSGGGSASSTDTEAQGRGVQMAIKAECEKAIQNGLRPGGSIWKAMNQR